VQQWSPLSWILLQRQLLSFIVFLLYHLLSFLKHADLIPFRWPRTKLILDDCAAGCNCTSRNFRDIRDTSVRIFIASRMHLFIFKQMTCPFIIARNKVGRSNYVAVRVGGVQSTTNRKLRVVLKINLSRHYIAMSPYISRHTVRWRYLSGVKRLIFSAAL